MKKSVKFVACIFDLDGVIVETAKYHFAAWKRIADSLEIPFNHEHNEQLKGVSRVNSLKYILGLGNKELSETKFQFYLDQKNTWYLESIRDLDQEEALPGVLALIRELKQNNIKLAIGSASKNARRILEAISIIDQFDVIMDGNTSPKSKPDPQVFTMGADAMNVQPEQCIVFEDSLKGVRAANSAGFFSIGIGDEESLKEAQIVVPGFSDIDFDQLCTIFKAKNIV